MRKKLLNESIELLIAGTAATWIGLWINKIYQENRFKNQVINTKQFLKELTDALEEYGGVDEFIKKFKPRLRAEKDYDPEIIIAAGGYKSARWIATQGVDYSKIIDKLLDGKSVTQFANKYYKSDVEGFKKKIGNLFYYMFESEKFKDEYTKIVKKVAEKEAEEIRKKNKFKKESIKLKALLPKI